MFIESNLYISFKFIEAKTPQELEKSMLAIQVKSRIPVNFTPPQYVAGKWTSWYLHDYSKEVRALSKIKLENKG